MVQPMPHHHFEWLTWDERAKSITAIHAESTPLVAAQVGKVHRVEDLAIPTIRKDITWRAHCMIHDLDWQHMATTVSFGHFVGIKFGQSCDNHLQDDVYILIY